MAEIHDVSMDDHNKYAQRIEQQRREPLQYTDDRQVAGPAKVDVTTPSYPSQIESLMGEDLCNLPWSVFPAIPDDLTKRTNCFSSELIPRLPQETLDSVQKRLDTLPERTTASAPEDASPAMKWESEKNQIQYTSELNTMKKVVTTASTLNRIQRDANSGRDQYHKG